MINDVLMELVNLNLALISPGRFRTAIHQHIINY
jgi:hypothetical protein